MPTNCLAAERSSNRFIVELSLRREEWEKVSLPHRYRSLVYRRKKYEVGSRVIGDPKGQPLRSAISNKHIVVISLSRLRSSKCLELLRLILCIATDGDIVLLLKDGVTNCQHLYFSKCKLLTSLRLQAFTTAMQRPVTGTKALNGRRNEARDSSISIVRFIAHTQNQLLSLWRLAGSTIYSGCRNDTVDSTGCQ